MEAKHAPGYRLRWRKNEPLRGLARIVAGPRGSTLFDANGTRFATADALHATFGGDSWYWVAGWESSVPHYNSCDEKKRLSEREAKAAALAYVRAAIAKATQ